MFTSYSDLENIGILKFNHNLNSPPSRTQLQLGTKTFIPSEPAQGKSYIDWKQWIECQKNLGFGANAYIATLDQIKSIHTNNTLVFTQDALHSAIFYHHTDLAKFLVSHNYASLDNSGVNSPLDLAIKTNNEELVSFLLNKDIDTSIHTPEFYALESAIHNLQKNHKYFLYGNFIQKYYSSGISTLDNQLHKILEFIDSHPYYSMSAGNGCEPGLLAKSLPKITRYDTDIAKNYILCLMISKDYKFNPALAHSFHSEKIYQYNAQRGNSYDSDKNLDPTLFFDATRKSIKIMNLMIQYTDFQDPILLDNVQNCTKNSDGHMSLWRTPEDNSSCYTIPLQLGYNGYFNELNYRAFEKFEGENRVTYCVALNGNHANFAPDLFEQL